LYETVCCCLILPRNPCNVCGKRKKESSEQKTDYHHYDSSRVWYYHHLKMLTFDITERGGFFGRNHLSLLLLLRETYTALFVCWVVVVQSISNIWKKNLEDRMFGFFLSIIEVVIKRATNDRTWEREKQERGGKINNKRDVWCARPKSKNNIYSSAWPWVRV